jgi:two-component system, response regulator
MIDQEIEILLVEDTLSDAELTIRALKKKNLANKLVHVKDGEEALEFLFGKDQPPDSSIQNRPKLVLLDLKLPKVDGFEVLRRLKTDEQGKSIPVVVLTSSAEERDIVQSYKFGVNSYITKPVDFDKFVDAVSGLGLYWLLLNKSPK